jgi:ribosomal protein S27AE
MNLPEAFDAIERWSQEGVDVGLCTRRYGYVVIDRGGIQRGLTTCPVCGAMSGMGQIAVSHDDGRSVSIDLMLYHYSEAGHPIGRDQLDSGLLFAIIHDVDMPPAALGRSEMTVEEALQHIQRIQQTGERIRPHVSRAGHLMVNDGGLQEGRQYCIHCGKELDRGAISVMHDDRRMIHFDVSIYHYAEAGHPITPQQLDSRRLLAMLADGEVARTGETTRKLTIAEALSQIGKIGASGQREGDPFLRRAGRITVYTGAMEMGLKPCPFCQASTNMGSIIVRHDDGRRVQFDPALYHYAEAGHPISETLATSLIDIVSDM